MRTLRFLFPAIFFSSVTLWAQTNLRTVAPTTANDFTGPFQFLSSDWMEGREAGARGGFMAADYIASMMQLYGLTQLGDPDPLNPDAVNKPGGLTRQQRSFFQNFEVVRYKTENSAFAFIRKTATAESALQLSPGIDYELRSGHNGTEAEAPLVFAGYGIAAPDKGYDDYKGMDVKDRIVVVLNGFPGHADSLSPAWRKLGKNFSEERATVARKFRTAEKLGAVGLIIVYGDGSFKPFSHSQRNLDILHSAMNLPRITVQEYADMEYFIPGDTTLGAIPCISLGPDATRLLFAGTGISLTDVETKIARDLSTASAPLKDKIVRFSAVVTSESLVVRNVLGIIRGKDSTKSIVVGAHYDHLGIRNGVIYNGADDNASGASGMLSLARTWSEVGEQPACNIIFAAWTAEEKGLLGSSYFVEHTGANPEHILLCINMDMISRSAPEDTAHRILSIGTMTGSDGLKKLAEASNQGLAHPFVLDLWDVTGHTGSDYGSFTAVGIPVMTFFSGFHDDYHSPRDIAAKADLEKMKDILKIVNDCIRKFAGNPLSE
jgi:hypothetical protein